MAEITGEILRQKEQTTPSKNGDIMHLLSNSGTRSLTRIIYAQSEKTQAQGEFLFDVDPITGMRMIETGDNNNFVLVMDNSTALTPKEHALIDCINARFTESIDFNSIKPEHLNIDTLNVSIDIKDYMRLCGKDEEYISNADNVKKFRKRDILPTMTNLYNIKMGWQTSEGYLDAIHPFSRLKIDGKSIRAELGASFAQILINHRDSEKMLFDTRLIKLAYNNQGKSRAKHIAYILAKKLFEQASIPNNIKNSEKGYFSLSVKKAVEAVKFCLKKDPKSPVKEIINPMFEALETLADENIIDYCFSGKNKHRLNDIETQKVLSDYTTFINAYICFKIINFDTEETKKTLLAQKIRGTKQEQSKRGRPKTDHNKVYETPKP